ncbi:MAG: TetR/AcrR family transcriptional regulator [Alcanivorax sp.]|nr:TetR/AcrR family transcriptional regulator [Alcanivorax sp.]
MSPVSPRKPGRPSASDKAGQRERLIDTALQLFSERGIAATPLNRIARQARVTPALLHYYFGNKQQLVQVVVEERLLARLRPVADAAARLDDTQPAGAVIEQYVRTLVTTVAAIPWLPPLWVREVLSDDGQLRQVLLRELAPRFAQSVSARVAAGQAAGSINPRLDARLMPISLIGLTVFALASRSLWAQLPGNQGIDTETLINHVVALLNQGMENTDV